MPSALGPALSLDEAAQSSQLLASLRVELPRLDPVERRAFASTATDEGCVALSAIAAPESLLGLARAWSLALTRAHAQHPRALRRYGLSRLAWLVEGALALEAALVFSNRTADASRSSLARARACADACAADLARALTLVVAGDPDLSARLASLTTPPVEPLKAEAADVALAKRLVALAKLARQLCESKRRRDRILCASVGLDEGDLEDSFAAAKALKRAPSEHPSETAMPGAAADEAEGAPGIAAGRGDCTKLTGRLVHELRTAWRMVEQARAAHPLLQPLPLPFDLREVIEGGEG